ncbi:MAG: efflux RND transporter periplasmic adaptor subunit [Pseudomonadota bacterium]
MTRSLHQLLRTVFVGVAIAATQMLGAVGATAQDAVEPAPVTVNAERLSIVDQYAVEESFSGLISARQTSSLGFQTGGQIASISADIGDLVTAGQTIARLDTRALRAQLSAANAAVDEARAVHVLAVKNVDRQLELNARGRVASQIVDEARAQADGALARIESAQAQADTLDVQIDLARLVAPFSGKITARMADEGSIAAPGMVVLELMDPSQLEVTIGVPASVAETLSVGQSYALEIDGGSADAVFRSATGVLSSDQRTVDAVFDISEPERVVAGSFAKLVIERRLDARGGWVPKSVLSEATRGLWTLYIAVPNGTGQLVAQQRLVEIVHENLDRAFVRGGVEDGDLVLLETTGRVTPGKRITVQVASEDG